MGAFNGVLVVKGHLLANRAGHRLFIGNEPAPDPGRGQRMTPSWFMCRTLNWP
jgi:hypothetical protein